MKKSGFTLIEVVIAMAILAGVLIVISNTWSGNFLRVRKSNLYNNVAFLLERKVTELEALYKDKPLEEIPESDSGNFGEDFPRYSWTMASQEFEMPDLSAALISREGGADDMLLNIIKTTQEFISKAIREVTVSVIVTAGKRKVTYSVTTYFVDYNQSLSVGGGAGGGGSNQ